MVYLGAQRCRKFHPSPVFGEVAKHHHEVVDQRDLKCGKVWALVSAASQHFGVCAHAQKTSLSLSLSAKMTKHDVPRDLVPRQLMPTHTAALTSVPKRQVAMAAKVHIRSRMRREAWKRSSSALPMVPVSSARRGCNAVHCKVYASRQSIHFCLMQLRYEHKAPE